MLSSFCRIDMIRLGNVMALTGDDCAILATFDQEAFGNVLTGSQSGFHITTKEYDTAAELYYFNARWYEPVTGRFVEVAPNLPMKEHAYSFVNQSPTRNTDPTGKLWRPGEPSCAYQACIAGTSNCSEGVFSCITAFCVQLLDCLGVPPLERGNEILGCERMLRAAGWNDSNITARCKCVKAGGR